MRPSDYLPRDTPLLNIAIIEHAHDDIGEGEDIGPDGKGTNRSTYVDRINQRFDSPLGSYWCANAVSGWWADAGALLPLQPGSCESWHRWSFQTGRFSSLPVPGAAVLYGDPSHASHIGVVARLVNDPTAISGHRVIVIEGNTSLGVYNRDGWVVAEKIMDPTHLIGFVHPVPPRPRAA